MTTRDNIVRRSRTAPQLNVTVAIVAGAIALVILAIIIVAAVSA